MVTSLITVGLAAISLGDELNSEVSESAVLKATAKMLQASVESNPQRIGKLKRQIHDLSMRLEKLEQLYRESKSEPKKTTNRLIQSKRTEAIEKQTAKAKAEPVDQEDARRAGLKAEIDALRVTIKIQNREIDKLQKQADELTAKINKLRILCHRAGLDTSKAGIATATVYLEKPRSPKWLATMYEKYHDKIASINGRYIDIGKSLLRSLTVEKESPKKGKEYRITPESCKIFQVINKAEALIKRPAFRATYSGSSTWGRIQAAAASRPELLFHVKGLNAKNLTDGSPFSGKLVYRGSYRYRTIQGSISSVQSFVVYKPLTHKQFVDALVKGFKLNDYRLVAVKPDKKKSGWAIGLVHRRLPKDTRGHQDSYVWYKIVSTPVR